VFGGLYIVYTYVGPSFDWATGGGGTMLAVLLVVCGAAAKLGLCTLVVTVAHRCVHTAQQRAHLLPGRAHCRPVTGVKHPIPVGRRAGVAGY
jgi:hypothetical protein